MTNCPSCNSVVVKDALKCSTCGLSFDETSGATAFLPQQGNGGSASIHSTESADGARFPAGTILAERYRIVSLLGRGGMGEVYKAEDLKLKQIVALKFLPEAVALDGASLARFQNEVRITRQISHPNVCRVYDIGETNGLHFLSMEFIDGEDLSVLLRRIGRLPGDKANEIARQICAGLAAAHDNGVLHRDLKPANIMIDGRGKARVTDFGVAVVARELLGAEATSGTPAYMAPEQLKGKEVTQKSDIYSLGLVIYEIFTGKKVYDSNNIVELMSMHETSAPTSPSSHVEHIDPLVERVIMRCLEREPNKRPATAIQVAAALPGGDPLAAALAAGETPSPEMVAASGEKTGLRPAVAVGLLAAIVIALGLTVFLSFKANWKANLMHDNAPDALAHRAEDLIHNLGYTDRPVGQAFGLELNQEYGQYVLRRPPGGDAWSAYVGSRPGPIRFWYRQSPQYIEPLRDNNFGWVTEFDPPPNAMSGMISVNLDPAGRLTDFIAVPPQVDPPEAPAASAPDWTQLFAAAGLDRAAFTETTSTWTPEIVSDTRVAWTGSYSDQTDVPVRVEAAAYRGRPVRFLILMPWHRPWMMQALPRTIAENIGLGFVLTLLLGFLAAAAWLARKNLKQGRGDRRGAARLGFVVFSLTVLVFVVGADHAPTVEEIARLFGLAVSKALFVAGIAWLLYVAVEPYVRRRWPEMMISWSRVLAGHWRDPLVARDLLIGILAGTIDAIAFRFDNLLRLLTGALPSNLQDVFPMPAWLGTRQFISVAVLADINNGIFAGLFFFFVIFLLRVITGRRWAAALILTLILSFPNSVGNQQYMVILVSAVTSIVAVRYGLLSLITVFFITTFMDFAANFQPWFLTYAIVCYVLLIAIVGWAFHTSLAGQKLFAGTLLED